MICKICGNTFADPVTFQTLFLSRPFCSDCEERYRPRFNREVIPYDQGTIEYFHVYPEEQTDPKLLRVLYRHMKPYFKLMDKGFFDDGIVLIIEGIDFLTFPTWFPYLGQFGKLYFISLFHHDFSVYDEYI